MNPTPPLGLAYLAAVLKSRGMKVSSVMSDALGLDAGQTAEEIIQRAPDVVAVSIATPAVNSARDIIGMVRGGLPEVKIIGGGPHATLFPEEMLLNGMDFVVRGEGEETIAALAMFLAGQGDIRAIEGISYRQDGKVLYNGPRPLIKDLDGIPFPAWEVFPIKQYESIFKKARLSLPILTSRGCPGKCTFCYKGLFGNRFRIRTPESILEEVRYLADHFAIEEFSIIDDCFTVIPKRAIAFCELLVQSNLGLAWTLPAGIRVDTVSEELLKALAEAGCYRVGLGIETGNEDIMKSIKKGITLAQVSRAVSLVKKFGIECTGNFMIGNLGETVKTVDDSIRYAVKLDPDYAQFTRAIPFPGSEMYDTLLKENKIITQNWDDYDYLRTDTRIFVHDNLSHETIQKKMREAYRRFYLRPAFILREIRKHLTRGGLRKLFITLPFALRRLFR